MRTVRTSDIREAVYSLISDISFKLNPAVLEMLKKLKEAESEPLAAETLSIIIENADIAEKEKLPLCQDCGTVVIFLEIGQEVCFEGGNLNDEIDLAVSEAYKNNYLRKSIVADPLRRLNTGTNTPAALHTEIVSGDRVSVHVYLKGGGSENMSTLKMFKPTDPPETLIKWIASAVADAGPNPCPPLFLGVGIGGTADTAMLNAKKALLRGPGTPHPDPMYSGLEQKILEAVNDTGIGPLGFGGKSTCCSVNIMEAPSHIASLAVALNMNCHSFRSGRIEL